MFKKSLLIISLVLALLTGCRQEEIFVDSSVQTRVIFEPLEDADATKASFNGTNIFWESGDAFGLWNGSTLYNYYYSNGSGSSFTPSKAVKKADSYSVYYPASAILSSSIESFTVNIPQTQKNNNGAFSEGAFPFIGTTYDLSTIQFKNVMGVLDVKLKTLTGNKVIKSVKVVSDKAIAGKATISTRDYSVSFTDPKYEIEIPLSLNVSDQSEAEFMVVLPPANHKLTITVTADDGSTLELKYKDVQVGRSKLIRQEASKDFSDPAAPAIDEKIILLNEGNWQSDNGQISYIFNHTITNGWFKAKNGTKIGDTPQHIIQINDNLLAISVNWSNIIYFISKDGKLLAQTENVPNCRYMTTDGNYLYITSYAHETALGETYERGYVAQISLKDYKVKATCEVGYEPEGIEFYNGKLYIANTGGYSFSEGHDYEHSISIVNTSNMTRERDVELFSADGQPVINLYGTMSRCGSYLCINSPGNYSDIPARTVIFNMANDQYMVYDFPSTYNTYVIGDKFFAIGSAFSYDTYEYTYYTNTINPYTGDVIEGYVCPATGEVSSVVTEAIKSMQNPYCVYQNPYTGHLYITDAASYASAGAVYEFDEKGQMVGEPLKCYINPGHMIAIK